MNSAIHRDQPGYQGRGNTRYSSTDRPQGYICSPFGLLHNTFQFQSPADIHGDVLKKKLDQTQPLEKPPARPFLSSPVNGPLSQRPSVEERFPAAQTPLRSGGNPGSLARTTETPILSAFSPRSTPFRHGDRSPNSSSDIDRPPRTRIKGNNCDDDFSTHSSYDFAEAKGREMQDGQSLKRLHSGDTYASGGQKRRAASTNDGPRGTMPSLPTSRSIHPTSIATANSVGRRPPVGPSPGGISPTSCNSPYTAAVSPNPHPQTSITGCVPIHPETIPDATASKIVKVQMPNATQVQSFYMCKCCHKKPERFNSIKELKAHEDEKPHECSFCGNRFKNKNEAKRHKNSLHVRRYFWSCSALSGYVQAFHDSTKRPGEADICGYCGDEFPRSGRGPGLGALSSGNPPRHATDQDWDERARHLQEVHKFRECNSSKKFFRADHFRQHVKHSHAGTSGMWTNMLENACMLEEAFSSMLEENTETKYMHQSDTK